jgi:error-prone DNA polymerase
VAAPGTDIVVSGLPEMTDRNGWPPNCRCSGWTPPSTSWTSIVPFLRALGATDAADQLTKRRSGSRLLVGGVKVATQTPPVKSGRRVIFLTLDDGTGPVDLTFFEDAQGGFGDHRVQRLAAHRGGGGAPHRRPRGLVARPGRLGSAAPGGAVASTLEATGDERAAVAAVHAVIDADRWRGQAEQAREGQRSTVGRLERQVRGPALRTSSIPAPTRVAADTEHAAAAGGMGQRRVLVHPSGFVQSPYTDIAPAGESPRSIPQRYADPGRKLWHSSPGSSGR